MKSKLKIILPVGLVALALICAIMVRQGDHGKEDLGAQQSIPAEETPDIVPVDEVIYTLPPIPSNIPKLPSGPESTPTGETVTVEDDGTVIITPDWQEQIDQAAKVVTPGSQVEANMGGGGGDLKLGDDGVFHGTAPTPAPASTPSPVVSTPVPVVSQKPSQTATPGGSLQLSGSESTPEVHSPAPVTTTPAPATTTPPEVIPTPEPVQQPQGGPPSYDGKYDGEISPDGQYGWIGGFGWIKRGGSNGGTGGQIDDSDKGWAPGEMGDTVGIM